MFCLPVVIAIVILAITSRRARQKQERARLRSELPNRAEMENTEHS